ncbi:MAG: GTPase, partial [Planctomycetota bacterium]
FLNALAGEERAIVSEIPGTTRDTVDLRIEKDGRTILVMDTAGIKRERSVSGSVDFYAQRRAEQAIQRSEVCLLLLDCTDDISRGDRQIARFVEDAVKPVVIVANKWDLAKGRMETEQYADYLSKKLTGLHYAPIAFVSAKEGKNVFAALETAESLAKQGRERVGTPQINKAIERAMTESRPPTRMPREPKIYYGTQTGTSPPTIMLFVNDPRLFGQAFRRFLENRFREVLPFKEIPLRVVYKRRKSIFARKEA